MGFESLKESQNAVFKMRLSRKVAILEQLLMEMMRGFSFRDY
jgi:hypothetical protein